MLNFELCLCAYAAPRAETVASIEKFRITSKLVHFMNIYCGDALLSRNRSIACHRFLKNNFAPYMIFLDDDIVFEPRHLEKIYQNMVDGYDIVGGLYAVGDGSQAASYGWDGKMLLDGSVQDIEYVATGFMGISRRALIKIKEELNLPLLNEGEWAECVPFFECGRNVTRKGKPIYISEDWDFCDKARQAGFKVYIDTAVQVGHMKTRMVRMENVVQTSKDRGKIDPYSNLLEHYAEFKHKSVDTVRKQVADWNQDLVGHAYKRSGKDLTSFYKSGDEDIITDILVFNINAPYIEQRLEPISVIRDKKVLDFGCGMGVASVYLNQNDNVVTGYDINKDAVDFCNFRKDKLGLQNLTYATELPTEPFDMVIAVDVLEHITDLEDTLKRLPLRKGGIFYHHDAFKHKLDVHIDHSENINKWLQDAGFVIIDEHFAVKGI